MVQRGRALTPDHEKMALIFQVISPSRQTKHGVHFKYAELSALKAGLRRHVRPSRTPPNLGSPRNVV